MKGLAQYFYAMAAACREGLKGGDDALDPPLRQYVYQDSSRRRMRWPH